MDSVVFARIGVLAAIAAAGLAGCTGSGSPETDLPDSAMLSVPADPAATPQPAQAESLRGTRTETPTGSAVTPVPPATPARTRPPLQPPTEARDIRPSIPYPPDTLTYRRDPSGATP